MKNSIKVLIAFLAGALVSGTIFFSNTELQRGSLRNAIKTPPCTTSTSKTTTTDVTPSTTATAPSTTTTPPADTTPPTITSIKLVNGAKDPCPNATCTAAETTALPGGKTWKFDKNDKVEIRFSESIDPHSINPALENGGEVDNIGSDQTGGLIVDTLCDLGGCSNQFKGTNIRITNIVDKVTVTSLSGYTSPHDTYNTTPPIPTFYGHVKIKLSSDGKTLTIINRDEPQPPVSAPALSAGYMSQHYQIFFVEAKINPDTNVGIITDASSAHNPILQTSLPSGNLSGNW